MQLERFCGKSRFILLLLQCLADKNSTYCNNMCEYLTTKAEIRSLNYGYAVIFQHLFGGSHGTAFWRHRRRNGTVLLAAALVAVLAVTLVTGGGGEELGRAAVPDVESYLQAVAIQTRTGWVDGRDTLLESLSVLPSWALADDTGIPEKFEPGLYQKIQNLVASQPRQESSVRSAVPPQYYDIVVLVVTHDADGSDISEANKGAVTALLIEAGARNVSAAQTLSFVTASVPVTAINSVSLYGEVFLMGDGQIRLVPAMTRASITVNATSASLDGTNGTGVTVAVIDDGINHPSLNDKTVHVECTNTSCTVRTDLTGLNSTDNSVTHGTGVAQVVAGSAGIAPGASLLDIDTFPGDSNTFYHALDWAITDGADVVNYSVSHSISKVSSCNLFGLVAHHVANEAIHMGMFLVGVAGNGAVVDGMTTYQSVQSPGCGTGVLTVGGIDDRRDDLRMYNDSGRGPVFDHSSDTIPLLKPEIVAPAVLIEVPGYYVTVIEDYALVASGTSFAAPMAAGAAAILLEEDGDLDTRELKAAMLVGADWKGPIPCTSVQFEAANATDDCSHARQPGNQTEANGPGSLGILNNVGFGVLNVEQSLDYVRDGGHIVSDSLGASQNRTHFLKVDDPDRPVKVILSWNHPTELRLNAGSLPSADITIWDLGLEVACPGMDPVAADSARQVNEFVVFMPARAGTCTATVTTDFAADYALASTGSFVDEGAFVTTWRTTAADKSITLPLVGTDINVDWGDGNTTTGVSEPVSHTYANADEHTVSITGGLERIHLNGLQPNAYRLASIDQWGDISWSSMASAFSGATNMVYTATDTPDLSSVTDTSRMFHGASAFNGDISDWDISAVTDMNHMFTGTRTFNQPLNSWNVSSVTDMSDMFSFSSNFNQSLSSWNVSSVTDMGGMFTHATLFNGNISSWNVSSVTGMQGMFGGSTFNQTLNNWDVSAVTSMLDMFSGSTFNQPLNNWDVSAVTNMGYMFNRNINFNQPLNNWNVSQVTLMHDMFNGATSFNQPLNNWDVSSVIRINDMFNGATSFGQNLGEWYVVLDDTTISDAAKTLAIRAQNGKLDGQNPVYGLGDGGDSDMFAISSNSLGLKSGTDYSAKTEYMVNVTSTGSFGTNNWRMVDVTVTDIDSTPPTFVSSELDSTTGVLEITFSEAIDVTPATNVVPAKIHIRESGSYTGGITLSAGELDTAADGDTISFTLNAEYLETITGLTAPELTIDPGAVRDTSGDLIDGTFDVSTATFVEPPFSVSTHTAAPTSMAFSNDGTKMFVVDDVAGNVEEYTLSTAFDVSTATFVAPHFDISSQEDSPQGMAFSNDGTKMFVVGYDGADINEYALSTAFDVSTATFVSPPFSVSAQDIYPTGMAFSNDGTKMFVVGNSGEDINEYTLSTAFNVSSAVFVSPPFSVVSQDPTPSGMAFSNDGTKMFVVGNIHDYIKEYTLSTAFVVSSAVIGPSTFRVSSQDTAPEGMAFSNDGAKMFVVGNAGGDINEYTLRSVYSITVTASVVPAEVFITTWKTTTANESITIPATGTYTIDWGDGTPDEDVTDTWMHMYAFAGNHTVTITGGLERIRLGGDGTNASKLISIDQWGSTGWTSMESAFSGASAMTYGATDAPDLSRVTDMSDMFYGTAASFNPSLNNWDVSRVTDMSGMFSYTTSFNQSLNNWNVSSVTDMSNMFSGTGDFNQSLNDWNVSRVTDMSNMFSATEAFNGDISNWNVSSVTNMSNMFSGTEAFNGDISNWNVLSVINMGAMFNKASVFDRPLNDWNVSGVSDMSEMFATTEAFNGDISNWNVSSVTDMSEMFADTGAFNGDISNWNVSSVTDMEYMFDGANSFHQNLGEWYVVANATSIARDDVPGVVAEISAQNSHLDGHTPTYGIDAGGNFTLFEIAGGNHLNMTSVDTKSSYMVNVTASGSNVFENDNNWHVLNITVTGSANTAPTVNAGTDQTVREGDTVTLSGSATDDDAGDAVESYTWSAPTGSGITFADDSLASTTFTAPAVTMDTPFTITLTAFDGTDYGEAQIIVTVKETSGAFITTWRTTTAGESITLPLVGTDITINWGDGNTTIGVLGSVSHSYAAAGDHTVSISGGLKRIILNDGASALKLRSIDQWGDTQWTSMENAFSGAHNMVYRATDVPDLSGVQSMRFMFGDARVFNGNISFWNVSQVTDMSHMFHSAYPFNQPLNNWNVSQVEDMSSMFENSDFNQSLNNWNVSQVTDMSYMFRDAIVFNQPLNNWDVSNVTAMGLMFTTAESFNGNISSWNVSQVTSMFRMFHQASDFNQPLNDWNVSQVTDMFHMFGDASDFNQPLNNWNVSQVTRMERMFSGATSFDQNLGNWYVTLDDTIIPGDLSAAPTVSPLSPYLDDRSPAYSLNDTRFIMDSRTLRFNMANLPTEGEYPLTIAATAKLDEVNSNRSHTRDVTITVSGDPARPFITTWETDAANQEITIPVGSSSASYYIDWGDGAIEADVTGDRNHTYAGAGNHTVYISGGFERINLDNGASASKLRSIDQWGDTQWTSMENAFSGAHNMVYRATDVPDLSGVRDMGGMFRTASSFDGDLSSWDVSGVTDMSDMFYAAVAFNQSLNDWNVSSVTTMSRMFQEAISFNQSLNDWNVSGVTDMSRMFQKTDAFNGDISHWNVSSVTIMNHMFTSADAFNQSLNDWNVSSVTNMNSMFTNVDIFNGDISHWNVSRVTSMRGMFSNADAFNQDISNWDVSRVTDMTNMFSNAVVFNQDISSWDVSKVTDMDSMFRSADLFHQNLGEWYVNLDSTEIASAPGKVGGISAQNGPLRVQNPVYGIGDGYDSDAFEISSGDLRMKISTPDRHDYRVNITSTGSFGSGNHRVYNVTVTGNLAPDLEVIANRTVAEGMLLEFNAVASDPSHNSESVADDTLTFSLDGAPLAGASISAGGQFTWTPTEMQDGMHDITVQVSDGKVGGTNSTEFTVTVTEVNRHPALDTITPKGVVRPNTLTFTATASDDDYREGTADTVTFSLTGTLLDGASITSAGDFSWMPAANQTGSHDVTVTVTDGTGLTDSQVVTITVTTQPNAVPDLNSIGPKSVNELVPLKFNATATDDDGDTLTFSLDGAPLAGASISAGGQFTWTPTEMQDGMHDITVQVSDGKVGGTNSTEFTVTVTEVNRHPALDTITPKGVVRPNTLTFTATASDDDYREGTADTVTFSLTGTLLDGASITSAGDFSWMPAANQTGSHDVTVTVTDGTGLTDSQVVTITVTTQPNAVPDLNSIGPKSVNELVPLKFNATATDDDGDTLTFSLDGAPLAGASISAGGQFTWTPTEMQDGMHDITVQVSDGKVGGTNSTEFTVTVTEVNRHPALDTITPKGVVRPNTLTFTATASDDDYREGTADTVTFSLTGTLLDGASITSAGDFSWMPAANQTGSHDVTVTVTDGTGLTDSQVVTITVTTQPNAVPDLNSIGPKSVNELVPLKFNATATDDDGDTLTFSLDGAPLAGASISAGGQFTWTPTEMQDGMHDITVQVSDGKVGGTNSTEFTVTVTEVNRHPALDTITPKGVVRPNTLTFTATASDDDYREGTADTVTFSLTGTLLDGASITSAGDFSWMPAANQTGSHDVTVTVTDGTGLTDSQVVTITVTTQPNAVPDLNSIGPKSVNELVPLKFNATATDDDGDTLTFSLDGAPLAGASISAGGQFTWTPTEMQDGMHDITVQVSDGKVGGTNSTEFTVTVTEVNRHPALDTITPKGVVRPNTLTFTATASDDDYREGTADTVTFSLTGTLLDGASITSAGDFSWMPAANQTGSHDVTVTVTDGTGLTDSQVVTITVTTQPNAVPDLNSIGPKSVNELVPLKFNATATDDDGDTLTFSLDGAPLAGASISAGGQFTWTPTEMQDGMHDITVQVSDGKVGGTNSTEFTVTVTEVNRHPALDTITPKGVVRPNTLTFTATASDDDYREGTADTVTFSLTGTLLDGASITSAGDFSWMPAANQTGSHDVTVTVTDGTGLTDSQVVTITVTTQPNAVPDLNSIGPKSVNELVPLKFNATATDDDGDTLTFSLDGAPLAGASISAGGQFTWTPTEMQDGMHDITVQVSDGKVGGTNSTEFTVTVTEVNRHPALDTITPKGVVRPNTLTFTATASDDDYREGTADTVTFSLTGTLLDGASITSAGDFSWMPAANQTGSHDVTVTVTDGTGLTDSQVVTITVTTQPNAVPDLNSIGPKSVNELVPLKFNATATDDDGDTLTFSLDGAPLAGASISAGGQFTWTPTEMQDGMHDITVQVSDGKVGGTNSTEFTVTVTEVNRHPALDTITPKGVVRPNTLTFTATASDDDYREGTADTVTFSLTGTLLDGASITSAGDFSWMPAANQTGSHDVTVTVTDGTGLTDSQVVTITVHDIAPLPISARASYSTAIALTLSETVTSSGAGPNGFSVLTRGDPVSVESITGSGTNSLVLLLNGTIQAGSTLSYHMNAGDVADEAGKALESFDGLTISFPSKSRSVSLPPAIVIGSLEHPQAARIVPEGPLQPVPADGTQAFPLTIDGNGYALHSDTITVIPTSVTAGMPVTITATVYDPLPLLYFGIYLHLPGEMISHLDSDAHVAYDSGTIRVTDPGGLLSDLSMTISENPDNPSKKTVTLTVTFTESMGTTNMLMRTWNTDRQSTEVRIFDALAVISPDAADPEPDIADPEPGMPDPEPAAVVPDAADPEPVAYSNTAEHEMLVIRMWSGFEPESLTDDQLLHALNLNYRGADIPDWVMTELGPLVVKKGITLEEFMTALQYVLEHA